MWGVVVWPGCWVFVRRGLEVALNGLFYLSHFLIYSKFPIFFCVRSFTSTQVPKQGQPTSITYVYNTIPAMIISCHIKIFELTGY